MELARMIVDSAEELHDRDLQEKAIIIHLSYKKNTCDLQDKLEVLPLPGSSDAMVKYNKMTFRVPHKDLKNMLGFLVEEALLPMRQFGTRICIKVFIRPDPDTAGQGDFGREVSCSDAKQWVWYYVEHLLQFSKYRVSA